MLFNFDSFEEKKIALQVDSKDIYIKALNVLKQHGLEFKFSTSRPFETAYEWYEDGIALCSHFGDLHWGLAHQYKRDGYKILNRSNYIDFKI